MALDGRSGLCPHSRGMDPSDVIRQEFERSGKSAASLAVEADVPRTTLRVLLKGGTNAKWSTIERLCEALDIEVAPGSGALATSGSRLGRRHRSGQSRWRPQTGQGWAPRWA